MQEKCLQYIKLAIKMHDVVSKTKTLTIRNVK